MRIVLASQSPRRRELMSEAGFTFDVIAPSQHAECGSCSGESTAELVARLALQKAADVATRVTGPAIVVACDTVADVMGQVLGKPLDRAHAEQMIRLLSGREHAVYSGLCVLPVADDEGQPAGQPQVQVERSTLFMQQLTDAQVDEYLESDAWVGKSGAFGYQDGHPWLRLIQGQSDNVVGLPMDKLRQMLATYGLA